jgi:tetratricopeptide (TPR) repeat protein
MGSLPADVTVITELARKHWPKYYALLLAEILSSILTTGILVVVNPEITAKLITYFVVWGITYAIWWYTNCLPKTKKGKVGFLISITTGEEKERRKIMEDFVTTLHEILKSGVSGNSFHLIKVPEHVAEKVVDIDDAQRLRLKCRAHFMIYGRVRLRPVAGREEHVVHLEGIVAHKPISEIVSRKLSTEFAELLPRRVRIATENDVFSFAFTSEWINCVSKYIIGIAAACSGDLDYAEKLQNDVQSLLGDQDQAFPIFAKLKQRVPQRLAEINHARASIAYNRWLRTRDPVEMEKVSYHLDKIPSFYVNEYGVLLLKSIFLFVKHRDVKTAIATLKKCKGVSEGTWLYNLGFLYAYISDLKQAIRRYRNAMDLPIEAQVIAQIEEFICWILGEEPWKYQLHYCLGFINWKVKGDKTQALKDFDAFLSQGNEKEFTVERELARKWMSEIQNSLDQGAA